MPQPHQLQRTRWEAAAGSPGISPATQPAPIQLPLQCQYTSDPPGEWDSIPSVPGKSWESCEGAASQGCDLPPQSLGGYVNKSAFALYILQMVIKKL